MSGVGLRLFQQLKSIDVKALRDDYFHEEHQAWDIAGLESDLKAAQDQVRHGELTHATPINSPQEPGSRIVSSHAHNRSELVSHNAHFQQTAQQQHSPQAHFRQPTPSSMAHPSMTPPNIMPGLTQEQTTQSTNNTLTLDHAALERLSKMPSPDASPSPRTDDETQDTQSSAAGHPSSLPSRQLSVHQSIPSLVPLHSPQRQHKQQKQRKRRMELTHVARSESPPKKRMKKSVPSVIRTEGNTWNESVLKKLHSLKRQVKNSEWFWEPVDEVKHSAPFYYLVCPLPSDYGTICKRLQRRSYADLDSLLRDCELVFINARLFNTSVHAVHIASLALEKKFKELMHNFVRDWCKQFGCSRTLEVWQKARNNHKPFAVAREESDMVESSDSEGIEIEEVTREVLDVDTDEDDDLV